VHPVIVGVGRLTQRRPERLDEADDPVGLAVKSARLAMEDAGVKGDAVDAVYFVDMLGENYLPRKLQPAYRNPAKNFVARAELGKVSEENTFQTNVGGNQPQSCMNTIAERISKGEIECGLLTGAEAIDTLQQGLKKKLKLNASAKRTSEAEGVLRWGDDEQEAPNVLGWNDPILSIQDLCHGLIEMVPSYAILEQAFRRADGITEEERRKGNASLFHGYNRIATLPENLEHSWFTQKRSSEEIGTLADSNRMVAFPYPKLMCAVMAVNQAASVIVMSDKRARQLGIPENKWVHFHGCGDSEDIALRLLQKPLFDRCFGMKIAGEAALQSASVRIENIKYFDVYSCFPVAVRMFCRELGIDKVFDVEKDSHRLTVTGGLPYHGGPGNNFVTHSIVAMVSRLREDRGAYGLITANGGVVSKHAAGIYSTRQPSKPFQRPDTSFALAQVRALYPPAKVAESPNNCQGTLRHFTITYSRKGKPSQIISIGDIDEGPDQGKRFVAVNLDKKVMHRFVEDPESFYNSSVLLHSKGGMFGKEDFIQTTFQLNSIINVSASL